MVYNVRTLQIPRILDLAKTSVANFKANVQAWFSQPKLSESPTLQEFYRVQGQKKSTFQRYWQLANEVGPPRDFLDQVRLNFLVE